MAETTNLPPGGYVVDYSQPNPEANEWEAYQYGYMPNAEKFKQYRVERYDPEFGAYVTDIYNADTGQFYATAKGTENKFLDKVVQPIAMAGLTAAIGSAGANLLGLGGAGSDAALASAASDADIAAGLIPEFGSNAAYGGFMTGAMTPEAAAAIENMIAGSSVAGLTPAQILAQGGAITDAAAGIAPAATAASPAATTPAATQAATSGASGLLSGLTPAQISSLLQAGVGLLGAGAAGSALGGGRGGTSAVGALPQQAPATYDQGYFDTLNRYYSTYLPGQQADTSMLQSWYNRQPMQTGGAMSGGMGGGLSPAAVQGQQVLGQQSNFNTLFNTLFGSVMGQPLNTNGSMPVTTNAVPKTENTAQFVTGPGTQQFGGFSSQEQYNQAVSENQAKQQAYLNELINYQPSAPFLTNYFANPETIPLQAGESIDRAILRLKAQDMEWAKRQQDRASSDTGSEGFIISNGTNTPAAVGLSWLPANWTNTSSNNPVASQVVAEESGGYPQNLQGLFQEVYGRAGTPEEIANVQGMGLGDVRNILETSLANWNAMQNR